ncbi:YihA family ribosome biogenesis GTP-binding protein [Patescibacteria group bacterium]|nr:YihA family ribosome biogenesis GTP-binding protein [Patescibacteria group bacterium]
MHIDSAVFVKSCPSPEELPDDHRLQIGCFGRSNVGKSTLINHLTGKKTLSRVSKTPGRTQLLNVFLINQRWYLVDLPGYGYAKQSKGKREGLETLIYDYLKTRPSLSLVIIDSNVGPTKLDQEMLSFLETENLPYLLIANKIDKQSNNVRFVTKRDLLALYPHANLILHSSTNGEGRGEILDHIERMLRDRSTKSSSEN